ncbi:DNA (cytosine-5-)-methyltransferase DMT5 [Exophiala dermatitidis]
MARKKARVASTGDQVTKPGTSTPTQQQKSSSKTEEAPSSSKTAAPKEWKIGKGESKAWPSQPDDWDREYFDDELKFVNPTKKAGCMTGIGVRFKDTGKNKATARPREGRRVYQTLSNSSDASVMSTPNDTTKMTASAPESECFQTLLGICKALDNTKIQTLDELLRRKPVDQECLPLPEEKSSTSKPRLSSDEDDYEDDEDDEITDLGTGYFSHQGLDLTAPPLSDIDEIFGCLADTGKRLGLLESIMPFASKGARIFTMCSGTESPIIALDLLRKALSLSGFDKFSYQHLGSAEIEPQKQAFIERNFRPPVIFRDVTEFIPYADAKAKQEDYKSIRPFSAYGRRADPPEGVHILIAGSSCVDYSSLNSHKKQSDGESAQTLWGIFAYARAHQPNIIILENVANALWDQLAGNLTNYGLSYFVVPVKVNSINYYVPQTRIRGYCLLINIEHARRVGLDLELAGMEFVRCMARFQRRASSPYKDFLLDEDDLRLKLAKENPGDFDTRERLVNWAACRKRHLDVRVSLQLGMSNPYTRRQNNSQCKLEDHAWQHWALAQTERVRDTLDINYLRYVVERDFDMRTKHRNFNVSQNVDRDNDSRQFGVVGCITPRGGLFHTARGGPLTGLEVFALQGMPIGDLNLSKDSSRDLQDLAGNAMTTTVIGAAILSALIACHKATKQQPGTIEQTTIFQQYTDEHGGDDVTATEAGSLAQPLLSETELVARSKEFPLQSDHDSFSIKDAIPLGDMIIRAKASQPLCRCEGIERHATELLICLGCFFTTCGSCSRDAHDGLQELQTESLGVSRQSARSFVQQLIRSLPPVLALQGQYTSALDQLTSKGFFLHHKSSIKKAFEENLYFQGVRFDGSWKATYESGYATLQLSFVPVFTQPPPNTKRALPNVSNALVKLSIQPTWLLFVKPPSTEPAESKLRDLLLHPVARMRPSRTLMSGEWELWKGLDKSHKVNIFGTGTKQPSWEQNLGLKGAPFNTMEVFSEIEVKPALDANGEVPLALQRIIGKYRLLQQCPAASGTLHRKVSESQHDDSPVFMFLDPHPVREAFSDRVVFATQPPRGVSTDERYILARLPAPWRPAVLTKWPEGQTLDCELVAQWSEAQGAGLELAVPAEGRQIRKWYQPAEFNVGANVQCRNSASTLFVVQLRLNPDQQKRFPPGRVITIELENKPDVLRGFGWIISHASDVPHLNAGWQSVDDAQTAVCLACSPRAPELRWVMQQVGKRDIVKPIENAEEAAVFEDALKRRPKPTVALMHCHGDQAFLEIQLNVSTLIHRANGKFASSSGSLTQLLDSSWRLTRHDPFAARPVFTSLQLRDNESEQPVSTTDIRQRKLWISQRKIIAWMQKQEQNPPSWKELALVESCLPAVGWRLEARARLQIQVRGGIIADDVGAGKTTTALGLVALDQLSNYSSFTTEPQDTYMDTHATLILMPKNIIKQWEAECIECLGWKKFDPKKARNPQPYYLLIQNVKDLSKHSRQNIQDSSLILAPWDMFEEPYYWNQLRKLTCAANVPNDPGRAFAEWLESSLNSLGDANQALLDNEAGFWKFWKGLRAKQSGYDRFEGFMTRASKKTEMAAQRKAEKEKAAAEAAAAEKRKLDEVEQSDSDGDHKPSPTPVSKPNEPAPADAGPTIAPDQTKADTAPPQDDGWEKELDDFQNMETIPALLHMFSFRRIIVDEFTYIPGKTLLALLKLQSNSRWLLSGTPPIHSYDSVNTMAKLLGTRISTYDEGSGKFAFGKDGSKMTRDRSDAQEFQSYHTLRSSAYTNTVYRRTSLFSELFIRKNQAAVVLKPRHEHFEYFDLSPSEMITYMEVDQLVEEQDTVFNKKPPKPNAAAKGNGNQKPDDNNGGDGETADAAEDDDAGNDQMVTFVDRLKTAVEQKPSPDYARMCAAPILAQSLEGIPENKIGSEGQILQHLAESHKELLVARSELLLQWFQEVWYIALGSPGQRAVCTPAFYDFMYDVKNRALPDRDVLPIITQLFWNAKQDPKKPARKLRPSRPPKPEPEPKKAKLQDKAAQAAQTKKDLENEMNLRIDRVHVLIRDLARGFCRLRLLELVSALVDKDGMPLPKCLGCGNATPDGQGIQISTSCGHIVACEQCSEMGTYTDTPCCVCFSPDQIKPASHFVAEVMEPKGKGKGKAKAASVTSDDVVRVGEGSRMMKAMAIIQGFKAKRELGLVFVQFPEVKDALVRACQRAGLASIDGFKYTQNGVGKFQRAAEALSRGQEPGAWLLILKTDSADAAGWNLHMANHVLFLSPLLVSSREERDATMEQAVGRSRRPRQLREVHVYHLAARATMEERMVASLRQV